MNEYVIRTENLTKEYGGQAAVDRINLHVPKGKIYALLGRNGAGEPGNFGTAVRAAPQRHHRTCPFGR